MLILGDKEADNGLVSVRVHASGDQGQSKLEDFLSSMKEKLAEKI